MASSKIQALWNHPAGPKTIHFWAPTFKWGISIANIADFAKPPENLSYPQQIAVTATGVIWSRYSTVINPKNWNLFSVNVGMAGTGIYQLSRKIKTVAFETLAPTLFVMPMFYGHGVAAMHNQLQQLNLRFWPSYGILQA